MIRFLTLSALFVFGAAGQFPGTGDQTTVRGQVLSDRPLGDAYIVELHPLSGSMNRQQTIASGTGDFHMSGVEVGDYRLIVTDHQGGVIYQQLLHIDKSGAPIEVRLPASSSAKAPAGTVTLASLRHNVPKQAVREYRAAVEARHRADGETAIAHLLKAVAIDPEFAAAHNDMAAQYLDGKRYDSALAELDKAEALDPASIAVQLNRAICLSRIGRFVEAETAARRAMQLDGASARSRYLLGLILINQRKFTREALDDLVESSEKYPEARLTAAQVLVQTGRNSEAREQLSRYLDGCKAQNCQSVQKWLEGLR
jgi:tetratricopeptide (TPR) repeat protein